MSGFGTFERKVARGLANTPQLRAVAKWMYQRTNYLLFQQRGQPCTLHPRVSLRCVEIADPKLQVGDQFFGYFDKSPWGRAQNRYLLHRHSEGDSVDLVVVAEGGVSVLGRTAAWNYQQGAMLQWCSWPTSRSRICWNEIRDGTLGSAWWQDDGTTTFRPWPIQALSPSRPEMVSLNYKRLHALRPEYGYSPSVVNFHATTPLDSDGLWQVDLTTGEATLLVSLEILANTHPTPEMNGADHKVNHALYSPDGSRIIFLHRWITVRGKYSRLYVVDRNGGCLQLLMDERMVSHYCWRDEDHVLTWARTGDHGDRYYIIDVRDGTHRIIGAGILDRFGDGHPSYSPDRRWIVTDTYPDKARMRHLLLFDNQKEEVVRVGSFFSPWRYDRARRCDLHPRWSHDGRLLSVDSAHEGVRRSYIIDVSRVVEE